MRNLHKCRSGGSEYYRVPESCPCCGSPGWTFTRMPSPGLLTRVDWALGRVERWLRSLFRPSKRQEKETR